MQISLKIDKKKPTHNKDEHKDWVTDGHTDGLIKWTNHKLILYS